MNTLHILKKHIHDHTGINCFCPLIVFEVVSIVPWLHLDSTLLRGAGGWPFFLCDQTFWNLALLRVTWRWCTLVGMYGCMNVCVLWCVYSSGCTMWFLLFSSWVILNIQKLPEGLIRYKTYDIGDHFWSSYWFSNKQHNLSQTHVGLCHESVCELGMRSSVVTTMTVRPFHLWRTTHCLFHVTVHSKYLFAYITLKHHFEAGVGITAGFKRLQALVKLHPSVLKILLQASFHQICHCCQRSSIKRNAAPPSVSRGVKPLEKNPHLVTGGVILKRYMCIELIFQSIKSLFVTWGVWEHPWAFSPLKLKMHTLSNEVCGK